MIRHAIVGAIVLIVPLTSDAGWQTLRYQGIRPHQVQFGLGGLTVEVNASAAPVIYQMREPMRVTAVRARGAIRGTLDVQSEEQGQPGFDDYTLRLGLVDSGSRRLGSLERRFAPAWVRTLFDLAPAGAGISRIRFFNLGVAANQAGLRRQHPQSELIVEEVVAVPDGDGRFNLSIALDGVAETVAVWIGSDGDDTRSTFTLVLEHLELEGR